MFKSRLILRMPNCSLLNQTMVLGRIGYKITFTIEDQCFVTNDGPTSDMHDVDFNGDENDLLDDDHDTSQDQAKKKSKGNNS